MTNDKKAIISFDNTEYAFAYKSNAALKKARFLFSVMGNRVLLHLGLLLMPIAIQFRFPFIRAIIRSTLFKQFVGGENLAQTTAVSDNLNKYNVKIILDYGVEGGEGERAFDKAVNTFMEVINYAASQKNIPFISIKVTGISRFGLLEKLDACMRSIESIDLSQRYKLAIEKLTNKEQAEFHLIEKRLLRICEEANKKNVGVLIDAEESWIQEPVDAMTSKMMEVFNHQHCIVYNTIQLYRHDRLSFLQSVHTSAVKNNYLLGVKLVRGAYMEKERARAKELGYASPIQANKEASDHDYDAAVKYCIENISNIAVVIATHNEKSNLFSMDMMDQFSLSYNHPHIHFSQLYGMSDNITFNLAKSGCVVSKYLPFGPIKEVVPYLMRRAQENSSVAGQTGRELGLIKKELERRNS